MTTDLYHRAPQSNRKPNMWYGMIWGTRDGDPLGALVLLCKEEISCAITAPSSGTKAGRSYHIGTTYRYDTSAMRNSQSKARTHITSYYRCFGFRQNSSIGHHWVCIAGVLAEISWMIYTYLNSAKREDSGYTNR